MWQYKFSYQVNVYTVNQDIIVLHAPWILLVSILRAVAEISLKSI